MLTPIMLATAMIFAGPTLAGPDPSNRDPAAAIVTTEDDTEYLARAADDLDLAALAYSIELDLAEAGLARKQQNPKKALEAATRAWAAATCSSSFDEQKDLLTRAVALRVQLLTELGLTEQALALAVGILIPEGEKVDGTLEPAPPLLLTLRRQVALDPRVAKVRRQVEAKMGLARQMPREDEVEDYVLRAFGPRSKAMDADVLDGLLAGDTAFLTSLGSRSAASLAAFTLYGPGAYVEDGEWAVDPLWWLTKVDDLGAARLILDHVEAGGARFRLRALDALRQSQLMQKIRWYEDDNGKIHADPTRWLDVLAAVARDPDALPHCAGELRRLTNTDGFHPPLQEALVDAMKAGGAEIANIVARATTHDYLRSSTRPFLRHALGLATGDARGLVAEALAREVDVPELRALFDDPDPAIRRLVAVSMKRASVQKSQTTYITREPKITAEDRDRLRDLSDDPDPSVRHEALLAILDLKTPFEAEFYDRYLDRATPKDLAALAYFDHPDRNLTRRVLAAVARCDDKWARQNIDDRLNNASLPADMDLISDAFEIRVFETEPQIPIKEDFAVRGFGHTAAGVQLLVDWGLRHKNASYTMTQALIGAESWGHADVICSLPVGDLKRLFVETHSRGEFRVSNLVANDPEKARALYRAILDDETTPRLIRIFAAARAVDVLDRTIQDALIAFLSSPTWSSNPPTDKELAWLSGLLQSKATPSELLGAVAANRGISDAVCAAAFRGRKESDRYSLDVARAIVERFMDTEFFTADAGAFVYHALQSLLGKSDESEFVDLTLKALRSTKPQYVGLALTMIERRPNPVFIDPLGAVVSGKELRFPDYDRIDNLQAAAARALSAYHDPRVIPYLLAGLKVSPLRQGSREGTLTSTIREALEIQEIYHEMTAALSNGRPHIKVSREDSIARLIGQLQDENDTIRRQAISALGTFGSLEALPYLIELLADEDRDIQHAAESAILEIKNQETMKALNGGK